jgi:hypothetical protein
LRRRIPTSRESAAKTPTMTIPMPAVVRLRPVPTSDERSQSLRKPMNQQPATRATKIRKKTPGIRNDRAVKAPAWRECCSPGSVIVFPLDPSPREQFSH